MRSFREDRSASEAYISSNADGRRVRRLLGEAVLTIPELEETLTCPVIFAPADSLYLLGATALEKFGVEPILGIIGGFLGSRDSGVP